MTLNFDIGNLDIELYSADSKKLINSSFGFTNKENINLNKLPSGEYFLKVFGLQSR